MATVIGDRLIFKNYICIDGPYTSAGLQHRGWEPILKMGSVEFGCLEKASIWDKENLLYEETGQNCVIHPRKERNASNTKNCI